MKILITGAAGFVGKYCIRHFRDELGWEVYATRLPYELMTEECFFKDMDLLDKKSVKEVLSWAEPDYILHLAAQSSVSISWKLTEKTIDINIKGTLNLLDSVKELGINPKIILVGSSEEYGYLPRGVNVVKEDTPLNPGNPYAVTKVAQGMLGKVYAKAYGLNIILTRAFNHIGPGQSETFVASDFCKQVALIEAGKILPEISVGNLNAMRDFTDVRDVVAAYGKILQTGKVGEIYNIGSGRAISINSLLVKIVSLSGVYVEVKVDEEKMRPLDMPIIEADISNLKRDTDWTIKYDLSQTLNEMIDWWRRKIRREG